MWYFPEKAQEAINKHIEENNLKNQFSHVVAISDGDYRKILVNDILVYSEPSHMVLYKNQKEIYRSDK